MKKEPIKARIKGVVGYIKKMRLLHSYSEAYGGVMMINTMRGYNVTLIQDDLTEIKFTGVPLDEIEILF